MSWIKKLTIGAKNEVGNRHFASLHEITQRNQFFFLIHNFDISVEMKLHKS